MSGYFAGEEVSAVNIDTPKFLHAVWWVCYGIEVLGEAGRCDKVVDFAVIFDNIGHDVLDRHVVGHVTVVGRDFRDPACVNSQKALLKLVGSDVHFSARIFLGEMSHKLLCLALAFVLCMLLINVGAEVEWY